MESRLLSQAHQLGRECEGFRVCRYNSEASVDVCKKLLVPAANRRENALNSHIT
jgi:hypothetical protein